MLNQPANSVSSLNGGEAQKEEDLVKMRTKGRSEVKGRRKRKNEKEGNEGKRRRKGEGKARRVPEGFHSLLVTVIILPDIIHNVS